MRAASVNVVRQGPRRTFNFLIETQEAVDESHRVQHVDEAEWDSDFSLMGPRVNANTNWPGRQATPRFKRPVPISQPQSRLSTATPPVAAAPVQERKQAYVAPTVVQPQSRSPSVTAPTAAAVVQQRQQAYVAPAVTAVQAAARPLPVAAQPSAPAPVTQHTALPATAPKTTLNLQGDLPVAVRQKSLDYQQRLQRLVIQINQNLPQGCTVLPWQPVPITVFEGELGKFMIMACDFHAHGPANTILLPALPAGVEYLNLPRHPFMVPERHTAYAKQLVMQLRDQVARDNAEIAKSMSRGDMSRLLSAADKQANYRKQMVAIAMKLAKEAFDLKVYEAHEARFRPLIEAL
jgi:hypothetical protein